MCANNIHTQCFFERNEQQHSNMDRLFSIPHLAPILANPTALSVLVNNPMICARTIARPVQMLPVVLELARLNPGAEHLYGALDDRFPHLRLKGVDVAEVAVTGSPEAAVVRQHHQAAAQLLGAPRSITPSAVYVSQRASAEHATPVERTPPATHTPAPVDARTLTAGNLIRAIFAECLLDRDPTNRPRWGGRLVEILANPRAPFGISGISDQIAPAVEEMKKDHPRLVASLVRSGGIWQAPGDAETLELIHSAAKVWARRLVRPILLGVIDQHRKQVAELNNDPKPAWYRHEELDKELKSAKDVHGDYLISPVITAKRPRD